MSLGGGLVVTGYGCVTPLGVGVEALGTGWRDGRRALREVRRFDTSRLAVHVGGEMADPVRPHEMRGAAHLRDALDEALAMSGLPTGARPLVVVATTKGFLESGHEVETRHLAHSVGLPARWLAEELTSRGHPVDAAAGATTISTACASGTAALAWALLRRGALESGRFDAVVCAGVDLLSDFVFRGFASLAAMDRKPCRPFDRTRAGMSAAEAAAVVVLETPAAARRRGAFELGRILGWGLSNDATHPTAPNRDGEGLARAIASALATSGRTAGDLGHVHAHGTATVFNDAMEVRALSSALGPAASRVPVTTLKGNLGHTFGAAGLVETIASLAAIRDGVLPGIAGLAEPDGSLDFVTSARPLANPVFLKLGAGFGGFDAAIVASGASA